MAEKRTRRRFTAAFKAQAVQWLLEDGKGLSEAATELGLSPGQLSLWRNEHLAAGSAEALARRQAEQAEVQRLKRENKRLEEEVEILKKAAAFFARGIARGSSSWRPSGATMPWPSCAERSARAPAASTVGCARSPLFRTGPRRRPGCAASAFPSCRYRSPMADAITHRVATVQHTRGMSRER